jgi:vacuolar-type H+-ATPase subunit E/Vma4
VSTEQVSQKAKEALKSVKEILERAEDSTHKAIDRAAPAVTKSLDSSMEAASKGFLKTVKTIDGATTGDQAKLFRAYKKLLVGQVDFVDARIRTLEERTQLKQQTQPSNP